MDSVISFFAFGAAWVFAIGGSIIGCLFLLWLLLYIFSKLSSMIMFRLWTTELTLRVARQLWHSTKVPPPKGWEPLPDDGDHDD